MHRAMLMACLPWLAVLAVSVLIAYFLLRFSRARLQLGRLTQLHRDQAGGVQSLSFVLTLPIFIMVMMLIVQVSQLMIGIMVVHYAAFAAARSAIVWIPAELTMKKLGINSAEGANCISSYQPDPNAAIQVFPTIPHTESFWINGQELIVENVGDGPVEGGVTYLVAPQGPKYEKILSAAVLACMPISPSQGMGYTLESAPDLLGPNAPPDQTSAATAGIIIQEAYSAMSPGSAGIPAVPGRLRNKLAYSLNNTTVEIRFFHQNYEPPIKMEPDGTPLGPYIIPPVPYEYSFNELGRQDLVIVKVSHNFALLPGPGRLLVRYGLLGEEAAKDAEKRRQNHVSVYKDPYSFSLHASAALNIEGEKSELPYVY